MSILSFLNGGTGVAIGKTASTANLLDINLNTAINGNFSQTNGNVTLDATSKQAWLTALAPDVLYNNTSGTNSTITLSSSAANYDHMTIYYKYGSSDVYSSVDLYEPDGKNVNLFIGGTGNDTGYFWPTGWDITISGASITTRATNRYYAATSVTANSVTTSKTNALVITRVEAW